MNRLVKQTCLRLVATLIASLIGGNVALASLIAFDAHSMEAATSSLSNTDDGERLPEPHAPESDRNPTQSAETVTSFSSSVMVAGCLLSLDSFVSSHDNDDWLRTRDEFHESIDLFELLKPPQPS